MISLAIISASVISGFILTSCLSKDDAPEPHPRPDDRQRPTFYGDGTPAPDEGNDCCDAGDGPWEAMSECHYGFVVPHPDRTAYLRVDAHRLYDRNGMFVSELGDHSALLRMEDVRLTSPSRCIAPEQFTEGEVAFSATLVGEIPCHESMQDDARCLPDGIVDPDLPVGDEARAPITMPLFREVEGAVQRFAVEGRYVDNGGGSPDVELDLTALDADGETLIRYGADGNAWLDNHGETVEKFAMAVYGHFQPDAEEELFCHELALVELDVADAGLPLACWSRSCEINEWFLSALEPWKGIALHRAAEERWEGTLCDGIEALYDPEGLDPRCVRDDKRYSDNTWERAFPLAHGVALTLSFEDDAAAVCWE